VDVCIWTKIQWLLLMKMHCMHLDKYLCRVPIIVYVCCRYPNGYNFRTYNIYIVTIICWSFNHSKAFRKTFSPFTVN
jgi:hypothetical protein